MCNQTGNRKDHLQALKKGKRQRRACCCTPRLVDYEQAPLFIKHNSHIWTSYRVGYCVWHAFLSLFQLHNETLNVWTHLLGSFLFAYLGYDAVTTNLADEAWLEKFYFLSHIWTISAAFFVSACYHLFGCLSAKAQRCLCSLDYSGITLIISTGYHFPARMLCTCAPLIAHAYVAVMTLCGALCMLMNWHPALLRPRFHFLRTATFVLLAGLGVFVFPLSMYLNGLDWTMPLLHQAVFTVTPFLSGVTVYVTFFPEKWFPGKFDLSTHSHVIFHCLIVLGCYAHYSNFLLMHHMVRTNDPCGAA